MDRVGNKSPNRVFTPARHVAGQTMEKLAGREGKPKVSPSFTMSGFMDLPIVWLFRPLPKLLLGEWEAGI